MYEQGVNISIYLRDKYGSDNTPEIIEMAYDLQAGSYTTKMKDITEKKLRENIGSELAKNILSVLRNPCSILEAGIGEGNQLSEVLACINKPVASYGFDISWSRIMYAKKWLHEQKYPDVTLFTGDLLHIPCTDNAFDIVYTCHAVEPNRGNEELILRELFRITKKYLLLLEPSYELADEKAKQRMDVMGYVKNLKETAESLGFTILEYKPFPYRFNELNPNAIMIIQKNETVIKPSHIFACPQFKTPLYESADGLFSPEALRVYPVIGGIPCLRIENGIIVSKYLEFMDIRS
jgi:ubiquinone/menaquinone biosynthesis C-methylase UbiE